MSGFTTVATAAIGLPLTSRETNFSCHAALLIAVASGAYVTMREAKIVPFGSFGNGLGCA